MREWLSAVLVNGVGGLLAGLAMQILSFAVSRRRRKVEGVGRSSERGEAVDRTDESTRVTPSVDQSIRVDQSTHVDASYRNVTQIGEIHVSLSQGRDRRHEGQGAVNSRSDSEDDDSWWLAPVGFGFALIVAVVGYARFHEEILRVVTALSAFTLAFLLAAVSYSVHKGVRLELSARVGLVAAITANLVSLLGTYFMREPPWFKGDLQQLLERIGRLGIVDFTNKHGADGFIFVAWQVIGLCALVAMLLLVSVFQVSIVATINATLRASAGKPLSIWGWLADRAPRPVPWSISVVMLSALTLALTSGIAYEYLPREPIEIQAPSGASQEQALRRNAG